MSGERTATTQLPPAGQAPRTVRFDLSDEEFAEVGAAAARAGLAKGAYAAEVVLTAGQWFLCHFP